MKILDWLGAVDKPINCLMIAVVAFIIAHRIIAIQIAKTVIKHQIERWQATLAEWQNPTWALVQGTVIDVSRPFVQYHIARHYPDGAVYVCVWAAIEHRATITRLNRK